MVAYASAVYTERTEFIGGDPQTIYEGFNARFDGTECWSCAPTDTSLEIIGNCSVEMDRIVPKGVVLELEVDPDEARSVSVTSAFFGNQALRGYGKICPTRIHDTAFLVVPNENWAPTTKKSQGLALLEYSDSEHLAQVRFQMGKSTEARNITTRDIMLMYQVSCATTVLSEDTLALAVKTYRAMQLEAPWTDHGRHGVDVGDGRVIDFPIPIEPTSVIKAALARKALDLSMCKGEYW